MHCLVQTHKIQVGTSRPMFTWWCCIRIDGLLLQTVIIDLLWNVWMNIWFGNEPDNKSVASLVFFFVVKMRRLFLFTTFSRLPASWVEALSFKAHPSAWGLRDCLNCPRTRQNLWLYETCASQLHRSSHLEPSKQGWTQKASSEWHRLSLLERETCPTAP